MQYGTHTGCGETPCPNIVRWWWWEGTKQIYCEGIICLRYVFSALQTVRFHLTKVGNQAKPLNYSDK